MTYNYIPSLDVALCGCAKCGTTSLYSFVYRVLFGKDWPYEGEPYVNDVRSPRWEGRITSISFSQMANVSKKFALLRDPKERLVSAWKSKVACDAWKWGGDEADRSLIAPLMRRNAKMEVKDCLTFDEFLETYLAIQQRGAGGAVFLDEHFMPQRFGCFTMLRPNAWTKVGSIGDPGFQQALAEGLGAGAQGVSLPHLHASAAGPQPELSPGAQRLLDEVTRGDYEALGLPASEAL